jgi:hypothetical protein
LLRNCQILSVFQSSFTSHHFGSGANRTRDDFFRIRILQKVSDQTESRSGSTHWLQTHPSIPSALQLPSTDTQIGPQQIIWGSFSSSLKHFVYSTPCPYADYMKRKHKIIHPVCFITGKIRVHVYYYALNYCYWKRDRSTVSISSKF